MNTDSELLRRFVEDRSEAAFTELVQRHLPMVQATALRRVGGDAHAADDVAQQVFVALARKAPSLRAHASLAGWLHLSSHHATAHWVRGEQRRKQREAAADSMHHSDSDAELSADAARLRPLLDDVLVTLKPQEREAIVLRFFSGRSFAEIGNALALSDEAARKRVDRALDKMQAMFARRGVTSTSLALAGVLAAIGAEPVPPGLVFKVAGVALAKAAMPTAAASLAGAFWPALTTAAVIAGVVAIVPLHQANADNAATLAVRESAVRAGRGAIESEIRQFEHDLDRVRRDAARRPGRAVAQPVATAPVAAGASNSAAASVAVSVTTNGSLTWQGDAVTLDEFLALLVSHQASAPQGESRMVVNAEGALFPQLNWVLDEVRKVGIAHLVVDSDAAPVGPMNTWF